MSLGTVELLNKDVVGYILKSGSTLDVFDMELKGERRVGAKTLSPTNISQNPFKKLISNLTELTELKLTFKSATKDSLSFLCKNLSLKLKRVRFCQMDVTDEDIGALVSRCKDLLELDLGGCKSLTNLVIDKIMPSENLVTLRLPDQIEFAGLHRVRMKIHIIKLFYHFLKKQNRCVFIKKFHSLDQ